MLFFSHNAYHNVRFFRFAYAPLYAHFFGFAVSFAQSRGVYEHKRATSVYHLFFHGVARCALLVGHNRSVLSEQGIEKSAFAGVGLAREHYSESLSLNSAAVVSFKFLSYIFERVVYIFYGFFVRLLLYVLFGVVYAHLGFRRRRNRLIIYFVYGFSRLSLALLVCGVERKHAVGVYQIAYALGLSQIDFAVHKRAARKFSGFSHSRARVKYAQKSLLGKIFAAVKIQLHAFLARVTFVSEKGNRHYFIAHFGTKLAIHHKRVTLSVEPLGYFLCRFHASRARQPYATYRAAAVRRGYCRYYVFFAVCHCLFSFMHTLHNLCTASYPHCG